MTTVQPTLTLTDTPDPALRDILYANFRAHSASLGLSGQFAEFAIQVERDGVVLGGLMARVGRAWLTIELLALPLAEHGAGLGRALMAMAEAEAAARGCVGAYLYTFAFQAPGFYEKLGYREFGRLLDDDPRLTRIWFSKRF